MSEFTEGVCQDGAAILKNGKPMTVDLIIQHLNSIRDCQDEGDSWRRVSERLQREKVELQAENAALKKYEAAHGRLIALRNHHAKLIDEPETSPILYRENLVQQLTESIEGVFAHDVVSLKAERDALIEAAREAKAIVSELTGELFDLYADDESELPQKANKARQILIIATLPTTPEEKL